MKIAQIHTLGAGGAYQAGNRLHKGLLKQGVDSKEIILHKCEPDAGKFFFLDNSSFFDRARYSLKHKIRVRLLRRKLAVLPPAQFTYPTSAYDVTAHHWVKNADIINLHWVANFIDYPTFFKKINKHVVWTLHDENPFSGGFHYEIYKQIGYNALDKQVLSIKQRALASFDLLTVVSPSRWLMKKSLASDLFGNYSHFCIPNSIDTEVFKPLSKERARKKFNLPVDKKIVLFAADNVADERKGIGSFLRALSQTEIPHTVFCVVGENKTLAGRHNLIFLPYLTTDDEMVLAYNAADVFVIPSLEDNLPNTVLEAMACGLPVVGFDTGGIPEMIRNGETGWLAAVGDFPSLLERLKELTENQNLSSDMGKAARDISLKEYNLERQAVAYQTLYSTIFLPSTIREINAIKKY